MNLLWLIPILPVLLVLRLLIRRTVYAYYLWNFSSITSIPRPKTRTTLLTYLAGEPGWGIYGSLQGNTSLQNTDTLLRHSKTLGDVYVTHGLFGHPVVHVLDPDAIKRISYSSAYKYLKTQEARNLLAPLIGHEGLILAEGNQHRRARKALLPSLHHESIRLLSATLLDEADKLAEKFVGSMRNKPTDPLPVHENVGAATFSAIVRAFLPKGILSEKRERAMQRCYLTALGSTSSIFRDILVQIILDFLPPEWVSSDRRAKEHIRMEVKSIVREAVDNLNSTKISEKNSTVIPRVSGDSMLEIILQEAKRTGNEFGRQELEDTVLNFLGAGQGTSAMSTSWTLYRLAKHLEWQERLREEVRQCKDWKDRGQNAETRMDALDKLPILDGVVRESLRLHPPIMAAMRTLGEKDVVGGFQVPVGTMFNLPVLALHMDPKHWKSPESFNPGRFTSGEGRGNIKKLSWAPFLAGPRGCIGQRFAMLEIKSMTAAVVDSLEVRLNSMDEEPVMFGAFTGQPHIAMYGKPIH